MARMPLRRPWRRRVRLSPPSRPRCLSWRRKPRSCRWDLRALLPAACQRSPRLGPRRNHGARLRGRASLPLTSAKHACPLRHSALRWQLPNRGAPSRAGDTLTECLRRHPHALPHVPDALSYGMPRATPNPVRPSWARWASCTRSWTGTAGSARRGRRRSRRRRPRRAAAASGATSAARGDGVALVSIGACWQEAVLV